MNVLTIIFTLTEKNNNFNAISFETMYVSTIYSQVLYICFSMLVNTSE